ncbi:MAG TPA: ATP-binding protein [Nitrososphaeraceae archaeon]|nr:ATP-binding protein [Nitrososphaeraceae archaeon]
MSDAPDRTGTAITEVSYGIENAVKLFSRVISGADTSIDICDDDIISHTSTSHKAIERRVLEIGAKLRYITEIKKDNIKHCKELMKIGQVRHIDGIKTNFVVTDTEYTSSAIVQQVHAHPEIVYSNVKSIIDQQQYLFENLWNKAIPAEHKLSEIEEGVEVEKTHVIQDPQSIKKLFVDIVKSAQHEVLLILPTVNAFLREHRIGIIQLLMRAAKERSLKVRILTPTNDVTDNILKNTMLSPQEEEKRKKQDFDFNLRSINISSEETAVSTVTIVVVDKKESLVFEKTDDTKVDFIEAIGRATYSNSKPTVTSYISIFKSLWKQVDLYEQLKVHDKMQKEFINIASHEMKTPTQAIVGYADLIQKHPEKREDMTQAISRNAIRLQRLTNDILDVTRIDSNTLNLHKEQFNLDNLIANVIQDNVNHIEKENLDIKLLYNFKKDVTESLPIDADRDRITQVISNLLDNAIKFTSKEKKGVISVSAERRKNGSKQEEEVIVSIKDTGEGINPEIQPRLFTKFATRSFSGTGLGLYISKSTVEAHGGRMWAENNPEGKGATFAFTLPVSSNRKDKYNHQL